MPNCKCGVYASYGVGGRSQFCAGCVKDVKMSNQRSSKCTFKGCQITPSFGPSSGRRTILRCATHKLDSYKNLTGRRCACGKLASYKMPAAQEYMCSACADGRGQPIRAKHMCECGKIATWRPIYKPGMPGMAKKPTHCTSCASKTTGMVSVNQPLKCLVKDCYSNRQKQPGIMCELCADHAVGLPALQCVEPCNKLIISLYDKCRKHRIRKTNEPYNPCKMMIAAAVDAAPVVIEKKDLCSALDAFLKSDK